MIGYERVRISGFFLRENFHLEQFKTFILSEFPCVFRGQILPNFPARNIVWGENFVTLNTLFAFLASFDSFKTNFLSIDTQSCLRTLFFLVTFQQTFQFLGSFFYQLSTKFSVLGQVFFLTSLLQKKFPN